MNTYDPAAVILVFRNFRVTGFADGTHIEVARDEDAFSARTGNDGEVTRSRNPNRMGTITFRLLAESDSNAALLAMAQEDELFGTAIGAAQVEDLNGGILDHSANAWIKKIPNNVYGKESQDREWVIACDALVRSVG